MEYQDVPKAEDFGDCVSYFTTDTVASAICGEDDTGPKDEWAANMVHQHSENASNLQNLSPFTPEIAVPRDLAQFNNGSPPLLQMLSMIKMIIRMLLPMNHLLFPMADPLLILISVRIRYYLYHLILKQEGVLQDPSIICRDLQGRYPTHHYTQGTFTQKRLMYQEHEGNNNLQ